MITTANWIRTKEEMKDICPKFVREWSNEKAVKKATLKLSALGIYRPTMNGKPISDYVLAPGWTVYEKRLQYQNYDVTHLIENKNRLEVTVGKGWFSSPMPGWIETKEKEERCKRGIGLIGVLEIVYQDSEVEIFNTDSDWLCFESSVRFSEIYDGEVYDANILNEVSLTTEVFEWPKNILIPQEGEIIKEQEIIQPKKIIKTPSGETLIDFGQELTGYVQLNVSKKAGDRISLQHGEVLDASGNFYNDNYRSAKAEIVYICKDGYQEWKPQLTFFGFRYIKVNDFPGELLLDNFSAIAIYSDIKQTGFMSSSNPELNKLFSNVLWGQKGNFLDVPTDCPQRDERLGWTGDVAAFIKTASYNYDVERFFVKWLRDLRAEQFPNGGVPHVVPDYLNDKSISSAWGDAVTIVPWQLYQTYGDKSVLIENFYAMKKWIDYISTTTSVPYLWIGGEHFGDWLGLDAPAGSYKGSSRDDFIASAYYAYSALIVAKTAKVINEDASDYEQLYKEIARKFRETFGQCKTQTEYALSIMFELSADPQKDAFKLNQLIENQGMKMQTGFVGTPILLHALSKHGFVETAYNLLLRTDYPSWLYSVYQGATTIWEHWDGIGENGKFWDPLMNSFNHYAYGAVADWMYEEAAGIKSLKPGFKEIEFSPKIDTRLGWLDVSLETTSGTVRIKWEAKDNNVRIDITTPVKSIFVMNDGTTISIDTGSHVFWQSI